MRNQLIIKWVCFPRTRQKATAIFGVQRARVYLSQVLGHAELVAVQLVLAQLLRSRKIERKARLG